jgi:hypothetical protein
MKGRRVSQVMQACTFQRVEGQGEKIHLTFQ